MAPTDDVDANPYTAPQANCLHDEDLAFVLRRAVLIFRRMGWGGVLLFGTVCVMTFAMDFVRNLSSTDSNRPTPMIVLVWGGYALFFWSILKIATALEKDFNKTYRRARWTAIIVGALFFPYLTLPCYFAVRHMEEYQRRYAVENEIGDLHLNSEDRA